MRFRQQLFIALLMPVLVCATKSAAFGQSSDQSLPTAVLTNEISGRIAALDLGDARLTRHFYAFEGTPGDLLITIDSKNLNGDVDIFTAVTFRPLMKTTLYASAQTGEVVKGLYLRTRQVLILRVEARTPNDEEGSYHVRFGGSFATFSGGIPVAENTEPASGTSPTDRANKRLSSVGATIAEPVVETPAPKSAAATDRPSEDTEAAKKAPAPGKKRPTRPATTARNSRGRTRPVRPKPAASETATPKTSEATTEATKTDAATESAKKETGETTDEKTGAAKSKAQELPAPGAHLIIESKDGTRIDRPMSTVRRVVVEGGVIVIVLKTGHIERVLMSTVNRMAIEP